MNCRRTQILALGLWTAVVCGTASAQNDAAPPADASGNNSTAAAPESQTSGKAHDNTFVIGNDDVLGINVWKQPELTRSIPVRSDGRISLPLIGEVQAAGDTPLQLEQAIAEKLKTYITQPDVTVMVLQINSQKFNILGRVAKPGSYPMSSSTTVLDAIAAAGGFQDFAKQKDIYILRQKPNGGETRIAFNYKDVIKGKNPKQNITLQPHDTIVVP